MKASSRWLFGVAMALAFAAAVVAVSPASTQERKPNILFILADNLGFGDLGVYGGGELRGAPTPRIDQLAAESLRLTQFLVETGCTPSRAALMTGRYSIRSGLSLVAVAGSPISLPAMEITMAEMLRDAGYATAMFGKWHLGDQPYSLPQNKGFDEFYGIPPGDTWDAFLMIPQGRQTKTLEIPLDKGPQIVEAKRGEPLKTVKPYTAEVRRDIDWELVDRGVDFMQRQKAAGKPFFLYLPISRTHFPNLPSKRFEGQSRIGQFGDSLMEGDAIVGRMLEALKALGLEQDTIVIFASDNGPQGEVVREFGGDMQDMGSPGPYRGELGDASEGSIRTAAMIRWPGRDSAGVDVRDVLDHGFLPNARAPGRGQGAGRPPDRRCRPDGPPARRERHGAARRPADLRRSRSRRGALEAVPHVLRRRGAGPQRLERRTRPAGDGQQRRADERLPQGLQYRVRSARGAQYRSVIRVGNRTDVEGCGGLQGQPPEISEPAGGESDALVIHL